MHDVYMALQIVLEYYYFFMLFLFPTLLLNSTYTVSREIFMGVNFREFCNLEASYKKNSVKSEYCRCGQLSFQQFAKIFSAKSYF